MADEGFAHTVNREAEKGRMEFYGRANQHGTVVLEAEAWTYTLAPDADPKRR